MNGNLICSPAPGLDSRVRFELDFDNRMRRELRHRACHLLWLKADGNDISDMIVLSGAGSANVAIDISEGRTAPSRSRGWPTFGFFRTMHPSGCCSSIR
jgi:hypothetical protein